MNTFGHIFKFTSFGESHGEAIGGVIDGCPAGLKLDMDALRFEMKRRRPGQSPLTTSRDEQDDVQFLSGIFEGVTTGAPIGFIIRNTNQRSDDYQDLQTVFRPSHADYTYHTKYGVHDYRGGGRSSARETAVRVVVGAIAKQYLKLFHIDVVAYTSQVGDIALPHDYSHYDLTTIDSSSVRCPDKTIAQQMEKLITDVKADGDTIGGIITCVIKGVPSGLGEPVYGKLHAGLASAMMSINAVKGFEYGSGFDVTKRGSSQNDVFVTTSDGSTTTLSNNSGGIQGGISNGQDIYFRVAFKPVATLLKEQTTITTEGQKTTIHPKGRHDACVLPRAVPVVEAMASITLMDYHLMSKASAKL